MSKILRIINARQQLVPARDEEHSVLCGHCDSVEGPRSRSGTDDWHEYDIACQRCGTTLPVVASYID